MNCVVPISKRGTVTLPPALRRKLGLGSIEHPLVILEERDGEIVLRPAAAVPVRDIPKSVIRAWIQEDEIGMKEFEKLGRKK